jgi:putative addiction module component (TIGR02574 family)
MRVPESPVIVEEAVRLTPAGAMMTLSLEQLEAEVLELSPGERRRLIQVLSASLDDESEGDAADVENAWAEEIRIRVEDYRAGRVQTVPSDEVFARLREQLK